MYLNIVIPGCLLATSAIAGVYFQIEWLATISSIAINVFATIVVVCALPWMFLSKHTVIRNIQGLSEQEIRDAARRQLDKMPDRHTIYSNLTLIIACAFGWFMLAYGFIYTGLIVIIAALSFQGMAIFIWNFFDRLANNKQPLEIQ